MGMALDEPGKNEQPVDVNGIGVLVQDFARAFVDNMVIDYVTEPNGEGFVIKGGSSC